MALAFAEAGAEVLVNDLRAERADDVVGEIDAAGGAAIPIAFDVTDYDAVGAALAAGALAATLTGAVAATSISAGAATCASGAQALPTRQRTGMMPVAKPVTASMATITTPERSNRLFPTFDTIVRANLDSTVLH